MKYTQTLEQLVQTLLVTCKTPDEQDRAGQELEAMRSALSEQPEVLRALQDESVPVAERVFVLEKTLAGQVHSAVGQTLALLVREGLLAHLSELGSLFQSARAKQGMARRVEVTSAVPLESAERKQLETFLQKTWNVHIQLVETVDEALIGGLRVRSEDWYYDATVRGRLDRVNEALTRI